MDDTLTRFFSELIGRLEGPFWFRFVLQPLMVMIYATRDGVADVRKGRPAYFWTILTRPDQRMPLLREGWKSVARVIAIGALIDTIYQLMVFRWIYPAQLVVVTLGLAFVPYVLLRGPIARLYRWWTSGRTDRGSTRVRG